MKQPLAVYRPSVRAVFVDLLILPVVAVGMGLLTGWHGSSYFLPSLLPAEPEELVAILALLLGTWLCLIAARARLQQVRLFEDGLELTYLGRRRRVPWRVLRGVDRGPGRFVLDCDKEVIRLPADLRHADELAAAIESRLTPSGPAAAFVPAAADLAVNTGLGVAAVLPLLVLAPWFDGRLPYPQMNAFNAAAWLVAAALVGQTWWLLREVLSRRIRRLGIDDHGVRVECWAGPPQDLPWAAVRGAEVTSRGLLLRAHGADCSVPLARDQALRAQEAIQARLGDDERSAQVYGRTPAGEAVDVMALWLGLLFLALGARTVAVSISAFSLGVLARTALLVLLAAIPALPAVFMRMRARRVVVAADGLRIEFLRRVVVVPWSRLRAVDCGAGGFWLHTETGTLRFSGDFRAADDLLERVRRGIDRVRAAEAVAERVDSGEVERWLRIGPDDVLEVRALRAVPLVVGGAIWLVILALLVPWLGYLRSLDPAMPNLSPRLWSPYLAICLATLPCWAFWLLYYPVHLALTLRADALRRVYATGHGLRWHEGPTWHEVGWDQVTSVELVPRQHRRALFYWTPEQEEADREVLAECGELKLRFHPTDQHAARLTQALEQLMAARRAGRLMPKLSAVPAAAISRVRPDEVSAERGISRV